MLAKIYSGAIVGLEAVPVVVEVDIASRGLPHFLLSDYLTKRLKKVKNGFELLSEIAEQNFQQKELL